MKLPLAGHTKQLIGKTVDHILKQQHTRAYDLKVRKDAERKQPKEKAEDVHMGSANQASAFCRKEGIVGEY